MIFYGDSITEGWRGTDHCLPCGLRCEGVPEVFARHYDKWGGGGAGGAAVSAIGGDQTAHLLWRLANGEVPPAHKVGIMRSVQFAVCSLLRWRSWRSCAAASMLAALPTTRTTSCRLPLTASLLAGWVAIALHLALALALQPKVAVVLIGTNDLGAAAWESPDTRSAEEAVFREVPGVASR